MLPVLPLRDVVVYPYVILPLSVSREKSLRAVDTALVESRMILLLSQKQMEMDQFLGEVRGMINVTSRLRTFVDSKTPTA